MSSVLITLNVANIAIYLDCSLSLFDFVVFASFIFFGLGILFYLRGDKIQKIITEKSQTVDVRSASIIDLVYTFILFVFKEWSNIPMSTTWIFLGLLGGRELAMLLSKSTDADKTLLGTVKMIFKDLGYATLGLIISVMLAIAVNENIQQELVVYFGL